MSKPFDVTLKLSSQKHPIDWMCLFGLVGDFKVVLVDTDLSTVTRTADRVVKVEGAEPWIMHLEFQSSHDPELELRLLTYKTLLRNHHAFPVDTFLLLLRPDAGSRRITGEYRTNNHDGTLCSTFRFQVIKIWEISPESILQGRIGTIGLLPLSNVTKEELPKYLKLMNDRIQAELDPAEIKDFWTNFFLMMGLRYEEPVIRELLQGVVDVTASTTYQAVLNEGRQAGILEGLEKGREEGRIREALRILLNLGVKKHGNPPERVHQLLNSIDNAELLERFIEEISEVSSWEELYSQRK